MKVPWTLRTMEEHRQRYPAALEKLYHEEDLERGLVGPWDRPENIFDCADGMRLLLSRVYLDQGPERYRGEWLHVATVVRRPSRWYQELGQGGAQALEDFFVAVFDAVQGITGRAADLEFVGFSNRHGVPHWLGPV